MNPDVMLCISPVQIRNPKFGIKPDEMMYNEVPCGRCYACLSNKRNSWTFRLKQEAKVSKLTTFVTLTYNDDHLPDMFSGRSNYVQKRQLQNYFKRLRKNHDLDFRYYLIMEYGSQTYRMHYHYLYFSNDDHNIHYLSDLFASEWRDKDESLGHIVCDPVNDARIHYVTKYHVLKSDLAGQNIIQPFSLMSKSLGKNYVDEMKDYHANNVHHHYVTHPGGIKSSLPRYYSDKLYTDHQNRKAAEINRAALVAKQRSEYKDQYTVESYRQSIDNFNKDKKKHGKL